MIKAFAAASAVILLCGIGVMPAYAGCAEELKTVEKEVASWQGESGVREHVMRLLAEAQEAKAEKKEKKCLNKIKALRGKM